MNDWFEKTEYPFRRREPDSRMNGAGQLVRILAACVMLLTSHSVQAFSSTDANTVFSAYNSAFYSQNGTNGFFKNGQTDGSEAYFWGQAETIECVIDTYEWTTNATAKSMITNLLNGFLQNNGSSWTWDIYNDDIMWAVMAFARGGQDTGMTNYCNIAKANFDACYARAWDTALGGGLYWTSADQSKNACVNGPGAIAAYLLYKIYNDTNYWNKATNVYYWERSVLFNASTGSIDDNIGTNGVISTWASTYNQGTFLGAANFVGQTNDATLAARYTLLNMTGAGVLPQYGIAGNNSGFNAIFLRWMNRFIRDRNLKGIYGPWLQTNAIAAWNGRRTDNLSWCQWPQTTPAGTNFYSWDCISSFEALQAADPTQTDPALAVPTDNIGYWPLDATSGTSVADLSGNGNNGTVSNATWNTSGRVKGCLNFNGTNSFVQITNTVANDFTIAFWVKTTQTGGSPQWFNGAGLVDGDSPGPGNDFGTALVAGKFAIGIGNPDMTFSSTSAINDGVWHHCAATRQQSSGMVNIYVDGHLQTTGYASRNTLNASARLLFGAIASGGGYFNGSLDEVRIFSRCLGSNEVSALYSNLISAPVGAPASVSATAGNNQVQLSWPKAPLGTGYNVKRALLSAGPYVTLTNLAATTYTDTSATNNRTYYYVVSATNSIGESTNSAPVSVNVSALTVWLKADALTGLTGGSPVSVWSDASGNGYNAIQTLGTNQPVYVTNAMNGMPVVRFNATNGCFLWFLRPVQDNFTIICVFQSTQGLGSGTLYYQGAGLVNGEVTGTVNDYGSCLFANGQVCAGTGNPDVAAVSSAGYNNGLPHIMTFKRTASTGQIYLYMDGTLVAISTGTTASLTAPNQLMLGALQTVNNFFSGDIAEVQIYNTALADTDRTGFERALKCKYSLTGGTVPATPTGLAGSAGNRQISLNWPLTSGAATYNLWRSTNAGLTYQLTASNLTTGSYVDTAAANGRTNFYHLTGTDACGASANSVAVAVWLPLPALGMNVSSNALSLTWPGWANDWALYAATNLNPPVAWAVVTNATGSNNNSFGVTLPIGTGNRFYRLSSP